MCSVIIFNYFGQMLEAKQIKKSYGSLQVLKGVDLTINKAEIVSIVGSSGAGKSTLLHLLGTLDKPDGGEILLLFALLFFSLFHLSNRVCTHFLMH